YVAVVLDLAPRAGRRRDSVVEPALAVDAVDGVDLHATALDVVRDGVDEEESLVLLEVGCGRREHQERGAEVAVDGDGHLLVEARAIPSMDLFFHGRAPMRV